MTALIPALSCSSCGPPAQFAELVTVEVERAECYAERSGNGWVSE